MKPTPNDQRSNVKNPTSPAHGKAKDNNSNQLNPNNPKFQGRPPQSKK